MKWSLLFSTWWGRFTLAAVAALVIFGVIAGMGRATASVQLKGAFEKLAEADTFATEVELTLHLPRLLRGAERPFTEVRAHIAGDVHKAQSGTPELTGTLYTEAKGRGNVFFANGDLRILEQEVLFRLDNLPVFLNRSGSLVNRWTQVTSPLLTTRNALEMEAALGSALSTLKRDGTETIEGERFARFVGQPSGEAEDALAQLAERNASGSAAWHQLSRLLSANNIDSLTVLIDPKAREVRRVQAHFVRPLSDGRVFDFALLTISFKDFGKDVTINRPEPLLTVQPQVFAEIFGQGEVKSID